MTNKIATVLKTITYETAGALPSDTVKNPKLNVNLTTLVLSARSYPTIDLNAHHPPPLQSMPSKHVPRKQAIPMQVIFDKKKLESS
ncbi:hypothetical protein Tco_0038976 [Tanacetum coccineum]